MQNKLNIEAFQDLDPMEQMPVRRISRTLGYQNSESIQEEDEESSCSKNIIVLGGPLNQFSLTCPNQPKENVGSEVKVPTIVSNMISNKSFDRTLKQKDSLLKLVDVSQIGKESGSESHRSFLEKKQKSPTLNQQNVKKHVLQFLSKLQRKSDPDLIVDPILDDKKRQISGLNFKIVTYLCFSITTILNLLSVVFVPFRIYFSPDLADSTIGFCYTVQSLSCCQIISDILLQRGPYQVRDGCLRFYKGERSKLWLDTPRLAIMVSLWLVEGGASLYLVLIMMILQISRQFEDHLNIYFLSQLISRLLILWFAVAVYFMCLYRDIDESEFSFDYCLILSISIITHNSFDFSVLNWNQAYLLSAYMVLTSLILIYTCVSCLVWLKPHLRIQEEKQKLLKTFLAGAVQKGIDHSLQSRCYQYLEFIIDVLKLVTQEQEDLKKLKDSISRKLSPELQEELQVSVRLNMLKKIHFFQQFSPNLRSALVYWFDQQQFSPEENIVQEHQIDDFCFYYILSGQVKVQFQGYYQGKPKRTFQILEQGQCFGEFSFITGIPPYISISSCSLSSILRIKRTDFLNILKSHPQDNELFQIIKENSYFQNCNMFECYYCKQKGHVLFQCEYLQFYPKRELVLTRHMYSKLQTRQKMGRRETRHRVIDGKFLTLIQEQAKQYQHKLSQEIVTSEDFPASSQLPYSENQTQQSQSYLSRQSLQKYSPDQQSMVDSQEEQDYLISEDIGSIDPLINQAIRKQANKATLQTAGFPFIQESFGVGVGSLKHKTILETTLNHKDKLTLLNEGVGSQTKLNLESLNSKDKLEETMKISRQSNSSQNKPFQSKKHSLSATRSMQAKLTFRLQQTSGNNDETVAYQQQQSSKQNSVRQQSNRSNTYSNPLSNNLSNNPSSNSRAKTPNNQSPSQYQPKKKEQEQKNSNSDNSISEGQQRHTNRKKSTKTGTKVSILNQQSQFQVFNTPENDHYMQNDPVFLKFDKMCLFKRYNPHNNYDCVIQRLNKFVRQKRKKQSLYAIQCYVRTKIKRVKQLLQTT